MRADASRTTLVTLVLSTAVLLKDFFGEQNVGRRKIRKIGLDLRLDLLACLDMQPATVFYDHDGVAAGDMVAIRASAGSATRPEESTLTRYAC
jgi:hypothetical protein